MSKSTTRRVVGSAWVDEAEVEVDRLRDVRAELRRSLHDLNFEGEGIWEQQERRWRRLEAKLTKLENRASTKVDLGLATNIDNLMSAIDESYTELDDFLE